MPEGAVSEKHRVRHHFTVDVEEYFQVAALAPYISRADWDSIPARIAVGVERLLDLLAERQTLATFFVLSWIADRHPALIRAIAARGHEIASHGTDHRRVTELDPEEFRSSVRESKQLLEAITGTRVYGYRAPSFSIVRGREWALAILAEEGYAYDSSLFPVRRAGYGFEGGKRDPHRLEAAGRFLSEFPPATVAIGGKVLPAGGGAYFRHLPYALVHSGLASAEDRGVAGTFYIHTWEVDPDQPRVTAPIRTVIRHYGGLKRTAPRIRKLLSSFEFQTIARTLGLDAEAPRVPATVAEIELTDTVSPEVKPGA
jgi:polysaccharide deacetylase family protein (PEP-CTERM system associated)